jgi:hypothetical protein
MLQDHDTNDSITTLLNIEQIKFMYILFVALCVWASQKYRILNIAINYRRYN